MANFQQWIIPGILFLVTIGFGFWVSQTGKPYPGLLFNIHKLIALGAAVITGIRIIKLDPLLTFPAAVIALTALSVLSVIAMFATGAMMSIQDRVRRTPKLIHQVSAIIITGSMLLALYVLSR